MLKRHFVFSMLSMAAGLAMFNMHPVGAAGEDYPTKPVRIVTAEPGGGNDIAARIIAQGLSKEIGQQLIVDNRGGASGAIAAGIVANAPPDGYTLLLFGNNIWLLPFLNSNVHYDPEKVFAPITLVISSPTILVVHPAVQATLVPDLVRLAKNAPGKLNYASAASGGAAHLAAELFKLMAGVDIVRVSYKGTPPALNDVIGGQVQLMFAVVGAAMPHVKSGRLRALGVTSAQPTALAPDLPTVAASGLPGYKRETTIGVLAPAATPSALVTLLNREFVTYL